MRENHCRIPDISFKIIHKNEHSFYIVDVFSEHKYAGNQLAVFLNAEHIPENQMQKIAAEINFAESTFITKMNPDEATAEIRIFTPVKEMQFAGHPIIGTSWVLMNKIFNNNPQKVL
jgi:trans-2,3-dihydro-3-hydroxyanthranilate isomerase